MAMTKSARGRRWAFTLLEMMIALGLTSMLVSIIAYSNTRMNWAVRNSEKRFEQKQHIIGLAEQLRWQLRMLYLQDYSSDNNAKPATNTRPGTLQYGLYGKHSGESGRDILIFNTTHPAAIQPKYTNRTNSAGASQSMHSMGTRGTVEVGYRIMSDTHTRQPYLAYRQFPWSDPLGLHEPDSQCDVEWQKLSDEIIGLELEFSTNHETWQQEWTQNGVPPWVRVTLTPKEGSPIIVEVAPATASQRW